MSRSSNSISVNFNKLKKKDTVDNHGMEYLHTLWCHLVLSHALFEVLTYREKNNSSLWSKLVHLF